MMQLKTIRRKEEIKTEVFDLLIFAGVVVMLIGGIILESSEIAGIGGSLTGLITVDMVF